VWQDVYSITDIGFLETQQYLLFPFSSTSLEKINVSTRVSLSIKIYNSPYPSFIKIKLPDSLGFLGKEKAGS
jgi:hypothetical protein